MKPTVSSMTCLYRWLLRLYPASHRREYGPLMEQLFRDRCREALARRGLRGVVALWSQVLPDLFLTVPTERFSQLMLLMKTQNIGRLSLQLLCAALALSALAAPSLAGTGFAPVCLYLSTLALLARAIVEWHRAPGEWGRGLLWMLIMLLAYGLIMPFWARMHFRHGNAYPFLPVVDAGAIYLNAGVALFRPLIARFTGTKDGQAPF